MKHLIKRFFSIFSNILYNTNTLSNSQVGEQVKIYTPHKIRDSRIGSYTYIASNAQIRKVSIGKFCSIGPAFFGGWGIHPTNGVSTAPCFYSTKKQNGITFASEDKIVERQQITIGNDVFIGMNVTVLDGVTIGNGAIIGAGTIVSKDVPAYAIVVGNPMRTIRFRFSDEIISELEELAWWDFPLEGLKLVDQYFFDIDLFLEKAKDFKQNTK